MKTQVLVDKLGVNQCLFVVKDVLTVKMICIAMCVIQTTTDTYSKMTMEIELFVLIDAQQVLLQAKAQMNV